MKKQICFIGALLASMSLSAEIVNVRTFRYAGPYVVQQPYLVDSVDVNSKTFVMKNLLETPLALDAVKQYIYLVNTSIVYYETLTTERSVSFPRNLCEKIVNTIHSGNTKAVSQNLKDFFQM